MLQEQTLKYFIVFIITVKCADSLEIVLSKTNDDTDKNVEYLGSFLNKSYEIPLFQRRYVTIRMHPNDFPRTSSYNRNVVGFKFQIKSILPNVVNIRKEVTLPEEKTKLNDLNTILVEDLFICKY
jgi:hypothetical protein